MPRFPGAGIFEGPLLAVGFDASTFSPGLRAFMRPVTEAVHDGFLSMVGGMFGTSARDGIEGLLLSPLEVAARKSYMDLTLVADFEGFNAGCPSLLMLTAVDIDLRSFLAGLPILEE